MANPLVATKLHVPMVRPGHIPRPHLVARLRRGAESKLTLISAPAGFGKSSLLAQWLASCDRGIAWLALDPGDNEPVVFWSHVIAALRTAEPGIAAGVLSGLEAGQAPDDALLTTLINELAALPGSIDLVLDDFHVIDSKAVIDGVAFLLEGISPNIHLVISTRADPALPLPRLRARGELVEIRAADLRFDRDETSAYLNDRMDLTLPDDAIAALAGRTEGWIAALQLAALSLRDRDDTGAFISAFTGNDRYIVDYLLEEVLDRQPEEVRRFFAATCHLDRLSAALCDVVTACAGSRAMLDALDRRNLFVVPLDDRREWYRYHHLFADVLRAHFADEAKDDLPVLHRRAGDWYDAQGERAEAVRHYLAGRDFERAAAVIELAMPELSRHRRDQTMREWISALPDAVIRSRPVLSVAYAGALASTGALPDVEDRLRDAEAGFAALAAGDTRFAVSDRDQLASAPGAIEVYRAALAQVRGDLDATIAHARRAVALAPPADHRSRAAAAGFLAIALWTRGDLEAAYASWTDCADGLRRAGHISDVLGASRAPADIRMVQGRLGDAARIYADALTWARELGGPAVRGAADMYVGLAAVCIERNELDAARAHLEAAAELGEHNGMPQHRHRLRLVAARLREAEGDFATALDLIDEAERVHVDDFFPRVRPIAAVRARVWIAQGRLDDARRWQREAALSPEGELTYLREYEHITLARLMLADNATSGELAALLARLLAHAEAGGRMASVVEILMLQALGLRSRNATADALVPLDRALSLAEPERNALVFLAEGEAMATLLKAAAKRDAAPTYARGLLAALGPATPRVASPGIIEPLSERELDVLRLLRSDLDGPQIARELGVSLNTMRTHTKAIYDKLGVNNRRAAVRRAEETGLLQR